VLPCVYDGDLSELLQQPRWFDGILDQIADWLSKAAANDLMDLRQGWEPMRTDECRGFLIADWTQHRETFEEDPKTRYYNAVFNRGSDDAPFGMFSRECQVDGPFQRDRTWTVGVVSGTPPGYVSSRYLPCHVRSIGDLEDTANALGVEGIKDTVGRLRRKLHNMGKRELFVTLAVRRPVPVIGTQCRTEFISFAVTWKETAKKNRKKIKYTVEVVSNLDQTTPALLRRFSGTKPVDAELCLVGCGSLGSKIGLHLCRAGQERFALMDKDLLLPHNNSRYGLVGAVYGSKSKELADAFKKLGVVAKVHTGDVRAELSAIPESAIVVDSTASLAVRNALARSTPGESVVHCSMYDNGRLGLMCIEGDGHNPRSDDLILTQLYKAANCPDLRRQMFEEAAARMATGQGCGSMTVTAPDWRISLHGAGMAARIAKLTQESSSHGEVLLAQVGEDDMSAAWSRFELGETIAIADAFNEDWDVRVVATVAEEMKRAAEASRPDETGGVLIGHVSYSNRCMTVVDLLPPPADSTQSPTLFVLGTEGLKQQIEAIERKSNGVFTYLGTWHSHPLGGEQSKTDGDTLGRIIFLRDYEPTVCLIWTPGGIGVVRLPKDRRTA